MKKQLFNKRSALVFKQFNRKGYSLFAALGKEVLIGVVRPDSHSIEWYAAVKSTNRTHRR